MLQNYIVDKLTLSDLKTNGKVIIPSFQRGIVWTKQHRKEFIETVKSGDPFGVVLVYQESINDSYYLIDGLQRLSTLKAYMDNPLEYVDENDKFTDEKALDEIFVEKYKHLGLSLPPASKLEKEKKSFLKKLLAYMRKSEKMASGNELWPKAAEFLSVDQNVFPIINAFLNYHRTFVDSLQLPDIIIHAIVYQGPKDRLPAVFETLNTSSVQLTKYEIFSSTWPNTRYIVHDQELIDMVWSKYEGLRQSSSFDVEVERDNLVAGGITLFEYCFGLSELILDPQKDFSFLFNKTKKSTDPTGFELLALACDLPVNKADDLYKDDRLGKSNSELLEELKTALVNTIREVSKCLKPWVFDLKNTPIKNDSAYQIYYMIMTLFKHLYHLDLANKFIEKRDDCSDWVEGFKKNAFKWYFMHQITGFWSQHRQVKDLSELINSSDTNGYYTTSISFEEWDKQLKEYADGLKETATSRTIQNESKLFLNYLYTMLIKEDKNRSTFFETKVSEDGKAIEFDIEHIVPVKKFDNFEEDLPMSTIGNLCYLPVKDNRSKRDLTIYEYAGDRPSLTWNQEFLSFIDYPSIQELSFINSKYDQFEPAFKTYVKNREERLISKFSNLMVTLY